MKMLLSFVSATVLLTSVAGATGFEKDSLWSGEHGGKAGAAVSSSHGPESLFFNPARMGRSESKQTLSLDFSPTWARFTSPMGAPESSHDSKVTLSPIFGLSYGRKLSDKFAVGLGSHVVGGTNIEHKNVSFGNYQGHYKTYLSIVEVAAGGSYQITPELSAGLAWRGTIFNTDYHMVGPYGTGTAVQSDFSDLKGNDYGGFRIGINYEPSERWGIGLTYQSEVNINAKGEFEQTAFDEANGNTVLSVTDADAKLKTVLPQSLTLGGHYQLNASWKIFGEYKWIDYSRVEKFGITALGLPDPGPPPIPRVPITDLPLKWKDQNIFRIAGEYSGWVVPLRLGYAYSTEVTHKSYAAPNYLGPANGHLVSIGSGMSLTGDLKVNAAADYYMDKGSVSATDSLTGAGIGDYKTNVFGLHLGMTYNF